MKICICSDSHGNWVGIQDMLDVERPQVLLFLGDGERDFQRVDLPCTTRMYAVCGNCDLMSMEPPWRVIELAGIRMMMTHGDYFGVKSGTNRLFERAREENVQLVVHGHTHQMDLQMERGITLLCPGSIGVQTGNYAVMEAEKGHFEIAFRQL